MTNSPDDIAIWISDIEKSRPSFLHTDESSDIEKSGPSFLHTDESRDTVRVYSVPDSMIVPEDTSRGIFSPSIVSIGPPRYYLNLRGNAIKKEVVHRMLISPDDSSMGRSLLSQLIAKVTAKEDDIKNAYADRNRIPNHLNGSSFAQMVVEDSCFVLFALSLFSLVESSKNSELAKWPALASMLENNEDEVLGDMLKLENQIPLFVLKCVADGIPGWKSTPTEISSRIDMAKALQTMCPLVINDYVSAEEDFDKKLWRKSYRDQKGHLLSLMVQFMTQELEEEEQIIQETQERGKSYTRQATKKLQRIATKIPSTSFIVKDQLSACLGNAIMYSLLILILIPFGVMLSPCIILGCIFNCIWGSPRETGQDLTAKSFQVFNSLVRSQRGIRDIRLSNNSVFYTMRLPKMKARKATEIILKNIISLERCHSQLSTARVTNYMHLMAFLIGDMGDVETLVQKDIISGKRADSEMRWMVDLRTLLEKGTCLLYGQDAASDAVSGMRNLREPAAWWKQFVRTGAWIVEMRSRYTSSPWVAISSVGALMLLGMTAVQVACLFTHCNGSVKG